MYNHGESKACEAVTADVVTSGITAPASLTDTAITTDGKSVTIAAADDETRQIMIAGIDGRIYYSSAASGTVTVPLPKGTYLVKAGSRDSQNHTLNHHKWAPDQQWSGAT